MVSFLHKNEHGLREQPVLFFLGVLFFDLDNVSTEGKESKPHHFECLQTEGNADDGDAADHAADEVYQSQLPAKKNGPEKVGDGVLFKLYSDLLAIVFHFQDVPLKSGSYFELQLQRFSYHY